MTARENSADAQQAAGGEPTNDRQAVGHRSLELSVPDMDCASCAEKVGNALDRVPVEEYEARPTTATVSVTYDGDTTTDRAVVDAVEAAGYDVQGTTAEDGESLSPPPQRESIWTGTRALRTWTSAIFVVGGLLFEFLLVEQNVALVSVLEREFVLADALFLGAVGVAGVTIARNGLRSLRHRSLDIDLLMTIAIGGAITAGLVFGESLYFEAAMLTVLFSVAELLETYSMDRARQSMRELMDLSPDEATVRRDGTEQTVPADEVRVGEVVLVRPGEKIPLDGDVVDGESAVNQAPITGESVPVDKTVGDEVYAGTINEEGYLEIEVTAPSGDNTLSRIIGLVEDAQGNKTEREQFVDRFADSYTPLVVTAGILLGVVPPLVLGGSWSTYILYGLTLFVLACPCAFVISTPVSVVSGITSAARNGVLIKGGNHLETMGDVDVVAFDKTGTLTQGELTVTDVIPLGGHSREAVLQSASGIEQRSEHPIAEAIVAETDRPVEQDVEAFESITGEGVTATLDGTQHYAGKPGLFQNLGVDLSHVHATPDGGLVTQTARDSCEKNTCLDLLSETVPRLQSEGKTVVLVGTADELQGIIAVADELRPEARDTVSRLNELGVEKTMLLTGDNMRTARAIADRVGIDDCRAALLPEEKLDAIEELTAEGHSVAMVGDGINDAPALATASVGVAMGAAGTDTALETADIALMGDNLRKLPYLYELARNANGVIRQNIWASLGVKAILAVAVPFGLVPIWLAVLLGDAGMTVGVTGNAMRLSRIRAN